MGMGSGVQNRIQSTIVWDGVLGGAEILDLRASDVCC